MNLSIQGGAQFARRNACAGKPRKSHLEPYALKANVGMSCPFASACAAMNWGSTTNPSPAMASHRHCSKRCGSLLTSKHIPSPGCSGSNCEIDH